MKRLRILLFVTAIILVIALVLGIEKATFFMVLMLFIDRLDKEIEKN